MVSKDVLAPVVRRVEAAALGIVLPLYFSSDNGHCGSCSASVVAFGWVGGGVVKV